jgi:hypothetical protein
VGDVVAFVWEGWWVRDSVTPTAGGDGDAAGGEQSGRAVVVDLMVKASKPRMPKGLGSKGGSLQPEFFRKALQAAACMQTQIAEELAAACRDDDWAWLQSVRLPVSQRESGCKAVLNF